MTTPPAIRYPSGPVTPQGAYEILKGNRPIMKYRTYDGSAVFDLMGGQAVPFHDRTRPESISVKSLKGLIPPWQMVDQKGATEDGTTFLDALYDPIEIDADLIARGRNPKYTQKVIRDWIAANDAKQPGTLSWFTQDLGYWWADVRWFKTPNNPLLGAQRKRQDFGWVWRADHAFWKSFDDTDMFRFTYETDVESFAYVGDPADHGWDVNYFGTGGGTATANGVQLVWIDDPDHPILTSGRSAIFRRQGFNTDTDNQVVEMKLGSFPEWSFPDNGYNYLYGRMPETGTPGDYCIQARFGIFDLTLSYFVDGVEHVLKHTPWVVPPRPGEIFSLVVGYEGNPRMYKILRNGIEVLSVVEPGTNSKMGVDYRSAGFGMHAGAAILTQATPAAVFKWGAGDNSNFPQSGYLTRVNVGDQPRFDRYTCFGPGTFYIADGPGSTEFVKFGPLLTNQVMQIRSDPRQYAVVDMTSIPPTPQELTQFQKALEDFLSFATGNNTPPLIQTIESMFGIAPPQGDPYSLLSGRFSNPLPPKSPGNPAEPQLISVVIDGGNADSKIIASGTPLRRYPI